MLLKLNVLVPSFAVPLNRFVAAELVSITEVETFLKVRLFEATAPKSICVISAKPPVGFGDPEVDPV